jgi:hypothetical protein
MMDAFLVALCVLPHPLPTSPIEGEVQCGGFDEIVPQVQTGVSPLVGQAGRGSL